MKLYDDTVKHHPIILTTAIEKNIALPFQPDNIIPAGTEGRLLDVIIENGKVKFELEFESGFEWYEVSEVEERF